MTWDDVKELLTAIAVVFTVPAGLLLAALIAVR